MQTAGSNRRKLDIGSVSIIPANSVSPWRDCSPEVVRCGCQGHSHAVDCVTFAEVNS